MKKLLAFLLLVAPLLAQTRTGGGGGGGAIPFVGAPTGSCSTTSIAVDTTTGNFYACNGGAWLKIGPGAAGSAQWNTLIAPTGNQSITMLHFTSTWTYDATTGAGTNVFIITDTSSNTGTGHLMRVTTAASSAAKAVEFDSNGNGVELSTAGIFTKVGTGGLDYGSLANFPAACGANLFATQIGATPGCTQPAFTNLSGVIGTTQFPNNTGIMRNAAGTESASELSGDVTTSGSNAATVVKINGGSVPTSAAVLGTNGSNQPIAATGHGIETPLVCADSSASGTAQVCNTSPTFTPATNDCVIYTTTTANTGAGLTLNVNSLGAKSVAKWLGSTTLAPGDVPVTKPQLACYDGTNWELSTIGNAPSGGGGSGTVNNAAQFSTGYYSGAGTTNVISGAANGLTGQFFTATNGAAPGFQSPTAGVGNGGAAITGSYTAGCDSGTALVDRGKWLVLGAAGALVLPDLAGSGCSGMYGGIENSTSGSLTVNRQTSDTFTVYGPNSGAPTTGATSFSLAAGQTASYSPDPTSTVYDVRISQPPSGGGSTPTGTGFIHVTSGVQDGTAQNPTLDKSGTGLADPTANASFTYPAGVTSGLTITGTNPSSSGANGANGPAIFTAQAPTAQGTSSTGTNSGGIGGGPSLLGGDGGSASGAGTTSTTGGKGGTVQMIAGSGGSGNAGNDSAGAGGDISIQSGTGGNASGTGNNGNSGNVNLNIRLPGTGGSGTVGSYGAVQVTSTSPASTSTTTGVSVGTIFNVTGITGGANSNAAGTAGSGSADLITAGNGGAGTGTNTVGGAGGAITLTGGNGGVSAGTGANSNGGNVNVVLGTAGTGGSGTAGKAGVFAVSGSGLAGGNYYTQGSTNTTANTNIPANSIIEQAPTAVTAYTVTKPVAASTGIEQNVNSAGVITQSYSGDSSHVANISGSTATIGTTTLCAATAGTACGQAGQYRISYDIWGSGTACSSVTAGKVVFTITWTDPGGSAHTAVPLSLYDFKSAAANTTGTFNFNTALTTEGANGSMIISTNGTIIQYATTYTACTTGTGTYNAHITAEQLQ